MLEIYFLWHATWTIWMRAADSTIVTQLSKLYGFKKSDTSFNTLKDTQIVCILVYRYIITE